MKEQSKQQPDPTKNVHFLPTLDAAIAVWETSRQAFQNEAGKEVRCAYMKATDELGQAISAWAAEQPEVADEFATWFDAKRTLGAIAESPSLRTCDGILLDTCHRPLHVAQSRK